MQSTENRRAFLRAALAAGAAWATADLLEIEGALAHASQQAAGAGPPTFTALTPEQGEALEAMSARLIPAVDGRPGARDAGAVHFIDRALATFNAGARGLYADGVAELNRQAASLVPGARFAALTPSQQDGVLRAIEQTPFFGAARFDIIVGTFGLSSWGGNRDGAGWRIIGFEHRPRFEAPFGFYDADANRRG